MITFTKEQLSEVMCKHAEKENGLHDLLEIMLNSRTSPCGNAWVCLRTILPEPPKPLPMQLRPV